MIEKENKIIYEIDGKEIGVVEYEEINKTTVDIYHTYVDPEYQGRHIASDLMEKLFKKYIKRAGTKNKLLFELRERPV